MLQLSECRPDPQFHNLAAHGPGSIDVCLLFQEAIAGERFDHLERGISEAESARAARFVFPRDKRAYVAAHWLKRRMLSSADDRVDPLSWQFENGPHGKPRVAGRSDLHFNLSHCRGLVACALRRNGPVGIDAEFIGRTAPGEVVAYYFAPAEAAWWQEQPARENTKAFFKLWTLKEAFVKATGAGFSQPLQDFSVCVDTLALRAGGELANQSPFWRFHQAEAGHDHLVALAWKNDTKHEDTVAIRIVQPDALPRSS
jgi:4'-phosphopantetheinyl transferase